MTPERSLEEIIQEQAFAGLLDGNCQSFFLASGRLLALGKGAWTKRHFYQLVSEADALESFLDDYGARYNRTYGLMRELVASVRWFSMAGFGISHLSSRFESYGISEELGAECARDVVASVETTRRFVCDSVFAVLSRLNRESELLGLTCGRPPDQDDFPAVTAPRQLLPRNVGQEDLVEENQRIAEVASKYLACCSMLADLRVKRVQDPRQRHELLSRICTESLARVYEASVHNLQSTYDTYIKNTVVEGRDARLPKLRGHVSVALHLLECTTFLTHFVERHESGIRNEAAELQIGRIIDKDQVQDVILNHLLFPADQVMQRGLALVDELLPAYTNVQELLVELPDNLKLHARPAALIVGIVGRYGTPVEFEVNGHKSNAGSILELLIAVGSNPEARQFVFRGDENPLRDIGLLFQSGLGEGGLEQLPPALAYLRAK